MMSLLGPRSNMVTFLRIWTMQGIHLERIVAESEQFLNVTKPQLDAFFVKVLLPRLLTGNIDKLDQPLTATNPSDQTSRPKKFCWCGGKEEGRMIGCDNSSCQVEWFHFKCAGLLRKPRGKWFCSDTCRQNDMQSNVIINIIKD